MLRKQKKILESSHGPVGDEQAALEAAVAAGYQGVQGANPARCRALGLVPTTFDVIPNSIDLLERARRWAGEGFACSTLLLGTGMEDDDQAARCIEGVLEASVTAGVPLYVETHRATVTQDIWRTLRLVERFPEVRFNGDLSHWYTGHDLPYGDFEAKVEMLGPILRRVRYLHGRIGTGGAIQIDIGDGRAEDHPSIAHFRLLWTAVFEGFIAASAEDPVPVVDGAIGFAPELLPADFGYALRVPRGEGGPEEIGDRWDQALVLTQIASECFAAAESARQ